MHAARPDLNELHTLSVFADDSAPSLNQMKLQAPNGYHVSSTLGLQVSLGKLKVRRLVVRGESEAEEWTIGSVVGFVLVVDGGVCVQSHFHRSRR